MKVKKHIHILTPVIILGLLVTACGKTETKNPGNTRTPEPAPSIQPASPDKKKKTEKGTTVRIFAAGSNHIPHEVLHSGNFNAVYRLVGKKTRKADISIITQEAPITRNSKKVSSETPMGMPYQCGNTLAGAGFNVICQATDHAMDLGAEGVKNTVSFWDNMKGVTMIGMHGSEESFGKTCIMEKNGIKIAFLNYTASLGGNNLHTDEKYLVKTLYNEETITKDIKKAKKEADFVIVLPHWGKEAGTQPDEIQVAWSRCFVDSGADLIVGTGPAKAQSLEILLSQDGKEVPCFYSLGDFVSSPHSIPRHVGITADIVLEKTGDGIIISQCKAEGAVTCETDGKATVFSADDIAEQPDMGITSEEIQKAVENITTQN